MRNLHALRVGVVCWLMALAVCRGAVPSGALSSGSFHLDNAELPSGWKVDPPRSTESHMKLRGKLMGGIWSSRYYMIPSKWVVPTIVGIFPTEVEARNAIQPDVYIIFTDVYTQTGQTLPALVKQSPQFKAYTASCGYGDGGLTYHDLPGPGSNKAISDTQIFRVGRVIFETAPNCDSGGVGVLEPLLVNKARRLQGSATNTVPATIVATNAIPPIAGVTQQVVTASFVAVATIPVPGATPLRVRVRDHAGKPVNDASVTLMLAEPSQTGFCMLNGGGKATAKQVGDGLYEVVLSCAAISQELVDAGNLDISTLALNCGIRASVTCKSGSSAVAAMHAPFELIRLQGVSTGPALKPREIPVLAQYTYETQQGRKRVAALARQRVKGVTGGFCLLLPSADIGYDGGFFWGGETGHCLRLPLSILRPRFKGQPVGPGSTVDLGGIDVLTANEHEERAKKWVWDFLQAMQFDNGRLSVARMATRNVPFQYNSDKGPSYSSGVIYLAGPSESWWGDVEDPNTTDHTPSYVTVVHEMGHIVHKHMVDDCLDLLGCLCDARLSTGDHETWTIPDRFWTASKETVTFFEATADFFAYCVYQFIKKNHPEFVKQSVYWDEGYLALFSSHDKAWTVKRKGGHLMEGVQTTFLRDVYDTHMASGTPERAFGDFLRVMDKYKQESWIFRWAPARTIREWLAMRMKLPNASQIAILAETYVIKGSGVSQWIYPHRVLSGGTQVAIDGRKTELKGEDFFTDILGGQTVEVMNGDVVLHIEQWTEGTRVAVHVTQGSRFRFEKSGMFTLLSGRAISDGKIILEGGGVTVTPKGTVVLLEVQGQDATVSVLEGEASLKTLTAMQHLAAGSSCKVATGTIGAPVPCDVKGIVAALTAQDVARTGTVSLTLKKAQVHPGEMAAVVHSAQTGSDPNAWIGFYRMGAEHNDYIQYTFLRNLTDRLYDVKAPGIPGVYNFRLFRDADFHCIATSDPLMIVDP